MGYGTTRSLERMAAALGMLDGAPIRFERLQDVPEGGVLCALPALLENGLLSGVGPGAPLPRQPPRSAPPLRGPGATLPARHHRLLGQRLEWSALLCREPARRSRLIECAARRCRAPVASRCPWPAQRGGPGRR